MRTNNCTRLPVALILSSDRSLVATALQELRKSVNCCLFMSAFDEYIDLSTSPMITSSSLSTEYEYIKSPIWLIIRESSIIRIF